MKMLLVLIALAMPLLASPVFAQDKAPAKRQNKMAECNQEAGDKKGADRKKFMKVCLTDKKAKQQEKMKSCNKDATGKRGVERKAFMK